MFRRAVASIGCAALLCACGGNVTPSASGFSNSAAALTRLQGPKAVAGSPIRHIIVVIQENRTTDNLFNGFPGADTVSKGLDSKGKIVKLQPEGLEWEYDPSHSHPSLATEYDDGKMGGFARDKCDSDPLNLTGGCTPPKDRLG